MKLVYYTDQVYLHGGIEKVLAQKLNYFSNLPNYEVHLITTEQKGREPCYTISNKVIHHKLDVNYMRTKSYFNYVNFKKIPSHIRKLKVKLKEIKPDVLVVCNYAFGFYFIPFISKGIKTIKEYHSSRYHYDRELQQSNYLSKCLFEVNNLIEKKYSHIVLLNQDEKKYYKSDNVVIIPNSITFNDKLDNVQRNKSIISAGRVAPVKQFDHLIKAWSLIEKKFPDWEIHIYGEGDDKLKTELVKLINELKVLNIHFMGATTGLKEKMEKASLYALTSATECFPMVLLEAMSCGLPIVSYNCPHGPKNIINDGEDGILVAHNNIDFFASKLSELIKNKELRSEMEKRAIYNVQRFEEKLIMKQWLNLFNKL